MAQKKNAQQVFDVVSLPAMSWVRASAVSSCSVMGWPEGSLLSMSRARRSCRWVLACCLRRVWTAAVAMPLRVCTAARPRLKKGSGRYAAYGLSWGRLPRVLLTSPRRLRTWTAGA